MSPLAISTVFPYHIILWSISMRSILNVMSNKCSGWASRRIYLILFNGYGHQARYIFYPHTKSGGVCWLIGELSVCKPYWLLYKMCRMNNSLSFWSSEVINACLMILLIVIDIIVCIWLCHWLTLSLKLYSHLSP